MSIGRSPEDAIPTEVIADRYAVERELGRGGMATVYLCTDKTTQAKVAVKILRAELGSAVVVERFLREIAFASELNHPRIPKVLDSGVVGDLPFYVMTYIDGESLRHRLDRVKQLPVEEAVSIATQVIAPTTYAHERGIVHRDIKPGNILIAADGVYVLDFGIARAIMASADDRLTSTGVAVGTPAYMSPEQALADGDLDARSDVYSLGCVLYEMIAGMPPFVGATPQAVMSRRFASPPPPLSDTREGVPAHVENAVSKALCRAPADRWQSAEAFGHALAGGVTSESVQNLQRGVAKRRTTYGRLVAGAIVLAVVLAATINWTVGRRNFVAQARKSLSGWDFSLAESRLRAAAERRPDDPAAALWLAQVLSLNGTPPAEWKPLVSRAVERIDALGEGDSVRLRALQALANGNLGDACARFRQLVRITQRLDRRDFTPTLALADCLRDDNTILPDPASPSGFHFRGSYHSADSLYRGLIDRYSGDDRAYDVIAPRLEQVLALDVRVLRHGTVAGTSASLMYGQPSLVADTLAYVPYALPSGGGSARFGETEAIDAAIARNQLLLYEVADAWTEASPDHPSAHEMLARLLETTGELEGSQRSALQELELARRLNGRSRDTTARSLMRKLRLGESHIRVLVRLNRFEKVGAIADSLLEIREPATMDEESRRTVTDYLWRLAALRGRIRRTIELEQRFASEFQAYLPTGPVALPHPIAADAIALNNYAAFGVPRDSILAVAERISERLAALVPPAKLEATRAALLARPLGIAAPAIGAGPVAAFGQTRDLMIRALSAFARKDLRTARAYRDSLIALHSERAPGQISMDVTYQQAWLTMALGDTAGAERQLDNSLKGVSKGPPSMLGSPQLIGALVRAMILRSQLAARSNQPDVSRTWSNAAFHLWGRGDPEIRTALEVLR